MPMQTTSVKPSCAPHPSKRNENKDPANTEIVQKASVLPRVSRLPVPVKNLHLHTPSDFTQSHCKWEEKPLTVSNAFSPTFISFFIIILLFLLKVSLYCYVLCAFLQGKARKKKPCTRPIPFNLSQPNSSRVTADEEPLQTVPRSRTATRPPHHSNNICNDRLKTPNSKQSKPPATSDDNLDSTQGAGKSQGKTPQTGGQCGPSRKLKTLANSYDSISTLSQNNATASAQSCVDDMNLLSLRSPTKTRGAPHNTQMAAKSKPSESLNSKLILLE